jgi:hypothetical protein
MKFSQLVERASALRWQQKTGGGGRQLFFAHAPTGSKNFSSVRWYWAPQLLHLTIVAISRYAPPLIRLPAWMAAIYALRLARLMHVRFTPTHLCLFCPIPEGRRLRLLRQAEGGGGQSLWRGLHAQGSSPPYGMWKHHRAQIASSIQTNQKQPR